MNDDVRPEDSFPSLNGWVLAPSIQHYTPETLFQYIDGAAEQYIRYGFMNLLVGEYRNEFGDLTVVEIYRHSSPVDAFGIYSQEQPADPAIVSIGARAHIQGPTLSFCSGPYYVKVHSYAQGFQTQESLQEFGLAVAGRLNQSDQLPPILDCFPEADKRPYSEKYIADDFLGYAFFPDGFTAEYGDSSHSFQTFIIFSQDSTVAQGMMTEYLQALEYDQEIPLHGRLMIEDPYHGILYLAWKDRCLWGTVGLSDAAIGEEYLDRIGELLMDSHFIRP
jgi:hypothetical protein